MRDSKPSAYENIFSLKTTWLSWVSLLINGAALLLFRSILDSNTVSDYITSPATTMFTLLAIAALTALIAIFVSKGIGRWMAGASLVLALAVAFVLYTAIAVSGMGQPH
ncbi:hypothetical protein [Thalassobacillus sp. CUG 92003]|uniref:hypothetical protein n=1 Tax=Thalassobacillus sp. CUG 92003 TaxID=2736641 RepID=UPI0015E66ABA|nr:hypothetical protein [Thalassobacillus sp. CUG 92003]